MGNPPFDSSQLDTSPMRSYPQLRQPAHTYAELYAKRLGQAVGNTGFVPRVNAQPEAPPGSARGGFFEPQPPAYYPEPTSSLQDQWQAPPSALSPGLAAIRRAAAPFQNPGGPRAPPPPPQYPNSMGPPPYAHQSGGMAPPIAASVDRPPPQGPRQTRPEPSHAPDGPVIESPLELIRRRAAGVLGTLPADAPATPAVSEWLQRHGRPQAGQAPAPGPSAASSAAGPYRPDVLAGLGGPYSAPPAQPLPPSEGPSGGAGGSQRSKSLERELVRATLRAPPHAPAACAARADPSQPRPEASRGRYWRLNQPGLRPPPVPAACRTTSEPSSPQRSKPRRGPWRRRRGCEASARGSPAWPLTGSFPACALAECPVALHAPGLRGRHRRRPGGHDRRQAAGRAFVRGVRRPELRERRERPRAAQQAAPPAAGGAAGGPEGRCPGEEKPGRGLAEQDARAAAAPRRRRVAAPR